MMHQTHRNTTHHNNAQEQQRTTKKSRRNDPYALPTTTMTTTGAALEAAPAPVFAQSYLEASAPEYVPGTMPFASAENEFDAPMMMMDDGEEGAMIAPMMPEGTLHTTLWGRVTFVPYPDEAFMTPMDAHDAAGPVARAFIGQLPYFVTDMQLAWLCFTFGGGHVVSYPERIMKRQANGERLPTGCIHAYCTERAVAAMADGMHKRMLIDDTGVWHAQSTEEWEALNEYVTAMKRDKTKRFPNRPYDTVVVQFATSTYVPSAPMPLTEMPVTKASVKAAKAAAASMPPPPAYAEAIKQVPAPAAGASTGAATPPAYAACLVTEVARLVADLVVARCASAPPAATGGAATSPSSTSEATQTDSAGPRRRRRRRHRRRRARRPHDAADSSEDDDEDDCMASDVTGVVTGSFD